MTVAIVASQEHFADKDEGTPVRPFQTCELLSKDDDREWSQERVALVKQAMMAELMCRTRWQGPQLGGIAELDETSTHAGSSDTGDESEVDPVLSTHKKDTLDVSMESTAKLLRLMSAFEKEWQAHTALDDDSEEVPERSTMSTSSSDVRAVNSTPSSASVDGQSDIGLLGAATMLALADCTPGVRGSSREDKDKADSLHQDAQVVEEEQSKPNIERDEIYSHPKPAEHTLRLSSATSHVLCGSHLHSSPCLQSRPLCTIERNLASVPSSFQPERRMSGASGTVVPSPRVPGPNPSPILEPILSSPRLRPVEFDSPRMPPRMVVPSSPRITLRMEALSSLRMPPQMKVPSSPRVVTPAQILSSPQVQAPMEYPSSPRMLPGMGLIPPRHMLPRMEVHSSSRLLPPTEILSSPRVQPPIEVLSSPPIFALWSPRPSVVLPSVTSHQPRTTLVRTSMSLVPGIIGSSANGSNGGGPAKGSLSCALAQSSPRCYPVAAPTSCLYSKGTVV